jgi:hypothetical protein
MNFIIVKKVLLLLTIINIISVSKAISQINGPLLVHPKNPRYFSDKNGKIIYLTGSHTWANFQDLGESDPPRIFDYSEYLNFLVTHSHNFFRLWSWEQAKWMTSVGNDCWIDPMPFKRTGPGAALDGKPKFNLDEFNQEYFDRMRNRIVQAGKLDIYVSIMLFNGWSIEKNKGSNNLNNPWRGHPFNAKNNINNINGDINGDDSGPEIHTLVNSEITQLQEAYIKKVIDTINDLDNVLFEISNESHSDATQWQYHIINFIKNYESNKPNQHPVGMTVEWPGGTNSELFNSPADWIAPNALSGDYFDNPVAANGSKVIISDTDHLCGICGDRFWVWKSFLRGINPIFMDVYNERLSGVDPNDPNWQDIRKNLGYTREYANRINLIKMVPANNISSSSYCLANTNPGEGEFLIYIPGERSITVDISNQTGNLQVEWFNPGNGKTTAADPVAGGAIKTFNNPFSQDAVLYLSALPASVKEPIKGEKRSIFKFNFPNPFNSATTFRYNLSAQVNVCLKIYNILGEEVKILVDEIQTPGEKVAMWDGKDQSGNDLDSGIYIFKIDMATEILTCKSLYLK